MEAGVELNALVAEKVMGWKPSKDKDGHWRVDRPDGTRIECEGCDLYDPNTGKAYNRTWWDELGGPASYSAWIPAAWEVVEKMAKDDHWLNLHYGPDAMGEPVWSAEFVNPANGVSISYDSAAEAICRAALKAKGVEV